MLLLGYHQYFVGKLQYMMPKKQYTMMQQSATKILNPNLETDQQPALSKENDTLFLRIYMILAQTCLLPAAGTHLAIIELVLPAIVSVMTGEVGSVKERNRFIRTGAHLAFWHIIS